MLKNAKIALTQLGFDLDLEILKKLGRQEPASACSQEEEVRQSLGPKYCRIMKNCGHKCMGVCGEKECLPCLMPECVESSSEADHLPNNEELCSICYTSELREEPSVQLRCGHVFHANCIIQLLKHGWSTLRITFSFM